MQSITKFSLLHRIYLAQFLIRFQCFASMVMLFRVLAREEESSKAWRMNKQTNEWRKMILVKCESSRWLQWNEPFSTTQATDGLKYCHQRQRAKKKRKQYWCRFPFQWNANAKKWLAPAAVAKEEKIISNRLGFVYFATLCCCKLCTDAKYGCFDAIDSIYFSCLRWWKWSCGFELTKFNKTWLCPNSHFNINWNHKWRRAYLPARTSGTNIWTPHTSVSCGAQDPVKAYFFKIAGNFSCWKGLRGAQARV